MYQYSFANVDLTLQVPNEGGDIQALTITGFGTGEGLINCMRRAPIATTQFGAYGDMVVSMQRIEAGDLSFPVLMNAPENVVLQDYANHFQAQAHANGQLIVPIQATMVDMMGEDECVMSNSVILAMPSMVRGQTMNTVTWMISFEKMTFKRKAGADHTNINVA